ncbi:ERF family protein [Stutzerimonas stutzeri]|uniref:ERF family protein n=1 Tax=Stutzerimonas stutzeri TaxID=316 RepID=UPI0034D3D517
MNKSEQINELATALAKAQGEIENASKSSNNPHFKSRYADLAEVLNTVRPVFASHGLAISQFPSYEQGVASVETIITHSSGQWMSGVISAPVGKLDAQGVGSAITYCRRYSLAAVAGIAQEDDDANSAVGHAPKAKQAPSKPVITKEQAAELRALLQSSGLDEAGWCASARIDCVEALTADRFNGAMAHIKSHAKEAA